MKIISYNVNGIRAAIRNGLYEWLLSVNPDVLCLQEVKATEGLVPLEVFQNLGYQVYWMPAEKKGYSGVAILSKVIPNHVEFGCGMNCYDIEGRVIRADFTNFSVINTYMPSGTTGELRQAFKMKWLSDFFGYIDVLKHSHPNLVICGDYNICHKPLDIHDPVGNKNSSGFLPEEREWVSQFLDSGFIDTFRYFNNDPHHYTWWSYRRKARERNLGWRIDYHLVTNSLENRIKNSVILADAVHSDHCPILLEIE